MKKRGYAYAKTKRYRELKKDMEERGKKYFKWVRVRKETEKAFLIYTKAYDNFQKRFWISKQYYDAKKNVFSKQVKVKYLMERVFKEEREKEMIERSLFSPDGCVIDERLSEIV